MNCKICSKPTYPFGQSEILAKYIVQYYQCNKCGFIQTENPYWLTESYSSAINESDIGLVGRNIKYSILTSSVILTFFDCNKQFVDYGGGYGLLVRIMRDIGFDFYRLDKYCENIFAKHFEAKQSEQKKELVTAFEVFEHLNEPIVEIEQMLELSGSILFSTLLIPPSNPKLGNWWYYGEEHGQHIALYRYKTLKYLAQTFGLNLYSDNKWLHLLTDKDLSEPFYKITVRKEMALLLSVALRMKLRQKSLKTNDYTKITGKDLI